MNAKIRAVLFDFGGVIAEEGFHDGLKRIAANNGHDPAEFFHLAVELIFETGYLIGKEDESHWWNALREKVQLREGNAELKALIFDGFFIRPSVLELVDSLRSDGIYTAILSDQTQWLDELDRLHGFFKRFDRVFNSYYTGMHKRDPETFTAVVKTLGFPPETVVFIDDNPGNVERAQGRGLKGIVFTDEASVRARLRELIPHLAL